MLYKVTDCRRKHAFYLLISKGTRSPGVLRLCAKLAWFHSWPKYFTLAVSYPTVNRSGYVPLNFENGSSVNSGNCDATELSFNSLVIYHLSIELDTSRFRILKSLAHIFHVRRVYSVLIFSILTIRASLWFIFISLVFFCFSKLLYLGTLQFVKGNFCPWPK